MWCFRRKAPGEKIRNPIQGEFFATEAIEGPAQALVRESIQNSLDAREGTGPVRVRILLASGDSALPASSVGALFASAWAHYSAPGNGLHAAPTPASRCPHLVIEDFGTKGLTGDPAQADPDVSPEARNPFFLFFRAEGLSAKTGTELGRWGIGKFVFPRSSLASTHFGLTVRHDDGRRLLLGAVTLRAHRIKGDGAMYSPDGLYGESAKGDLVLPIEGAIEIENFSRLFHLTRTTEPGLSVVVPFVDPDITFDKLLFAAVKDYFLPILDGRLEITLESEGVTVQLNAESLEHVVLEHRSLLGDGTHAIVNLAKFAISVRDNARFVIGMPDPSRAARWSNELVSGDTLTALQGCLKGVDPIAVRVPVTVRPKHSGSLSSWFDIFLVRDQASDGRPLFVREGIVISDVRGRRAREFRSLVIVDHKPLATMLGDSENPAHTQWQKHSSNFRGRYIYGGAAINFITDSIGEVIAIVDRQSEEADTSLTVDYFSVAPEEAFENVEPARLRKSARTNGPESAPNDVPATPRSTRVAIARNEGGFSVLPGSQAPATPYLIEVRCAYDIRSGNALKKWDPADFTLGSPGLPVVCDGDARLLQARDNRALIRIDGPVFHAHFQGFDVNRDVYVRVEIKESGNADQAA